MVFDDFPCTYDEIVLEESLLNDQGQKSSFILHNLSLTKCNDSGANDWLSSWTQSGMKSVFIAKSGYDAYSEENEGHAILLAIATHLSNVSIESKPTDAQ